VLAIPAYVAGKPPVARPGLTSYKLSSNENPYPPLPSVLAAVREGAETFNRYPDMFATGLTAAIADRFGVPVTHVATGTGSVGVLQQVVQSTATEGDEVVYAWRSFEAYPICVGLAGAESVRIPLTGEGRHDLDAMAAAVTARTRMILLCTPNNPTGPILTTEETERFIKRVPSDVVVVIDEAYQEFVRDEQAVDGIEMYRKYPNVAVLRTFSKAHGLAGLRVGYSVSQPDLTQHLRVSATPFAVSQIAEIAAVTSLEHFDDVVERVQSLVDERDRVTAGLRDLGWFVPEAQGNFVWLNLGADSAEFAALAGERALSVRAFADEGVRVSIGETEANTRFLELCAIYTKPPLRS
jgi:histidinol-phosphate aminotransferase